MHSCNGNKIERETTKAASKRKANAHQGGCGGSGGGLRQSAAAAAGAGAGRGGRSGGVETGDGRVKGLGEDVGGCQRERTAASDCTDSHRDRGQIERLDRLRVTRTQQFSATTSCNHVETFEPVVIKVLRKTFEKHMKHNKKANACCHCLLRIPEREGLDYKEE